MNGSLRRLLALPGFVLACQGSSPSPEPMDATVAGSSSADVAGSSSGEIEDSDLTGTSEASGDSGTGADDLEATEKAPEPAPLEGEGPGGAVGREARRQAVLGLLGDGESAVKLDLAATDAGRRFNPNLADEMTPKVWVSGRPSSTSGTVKQGNLKVKGELDREIIRRVVRSHVNELRACYRIERQKNPSLKGSLTIGFTITTDGKVASSVVKKSKLGNRRVEGCFAKAHRRWKFPKPTDGQTVLVTAPYQLK